MCPDDLARAVEMLGTVLHCVNCGSVGKEVEEDRFLVLFGVDEGEF